MMQDTTACVNRACEERMGCYRYRGVWNSLWQSVSCFPREAGQRCGHHSPLQARDALVPEAEADQRAGGER